MNMRLITALFLVIVWGSMIVSQKSDARPIAPITQFLDEQIYFMSKAAEDNGGLNEIRNANAPAQNNSVEYQFSTFWLRIHANVAFSAPGVGTLSIIPEVELIWE